MAGCKNVVHDNQVAKMRYHSPPNAQPFSTSPSLYTVYCITVVCFDIVFANCLLNLL